MVHTAVAIALTAVTITPIAAGLSAVITAAAAEPVIPAAVNFAQTVKKPFSVRVPNLTEKGFFRTVYFFLFC